MTAIFRLFHQLIFKKPESGDHKKFILLIYEQLGMKSVLKMLNNRFQTQNHGNILIGAGGLMSIYKILAVLYKLIFLGIALRDIFDKDLVLIAFT